MKYYKEHLSALLTALESGVKNIVLYGPPGTGKTSFAQHWAELRNAQFVYTLLHNWSSDEELFASPHIPSIVGGKAESAVTPGALALAAHLSKRGEVVLCLDELDKAPARVEALLLDFLQNGRVPTAPGRTERAEIERIWCFITTNNARPLSDALTRRCWRYEMPFLPPQVETTMLGGGKCASLLVRLANRMRTNEALSSPALDELKRARTLLRAAKSFEDGFTLLKGALAKRDEDVAFLKQHFKALWEVRNE